MSFTKAVVQAANVCLMGVIVSANFGAAAAKGAKLPEPLGLKIIAVPSSIKGEEITSAILSSSGLLALGTAKGHLSIVDRNLKAWLGGWARSAGSSAILGLTFSQDEVALASVTSDALFVWRLDDRTVVKIPFKREPASMALSRGGRLLAVADFNVSIFDVSSRRIVRHFQQDVGDGGIGVYEDVGFTPDSLVVTAAGVDNIDAWNVESGKKMQHWSCKCGADGVALSGDAALAVVGTTDAHALLWERASGNVVKEKTMSTVEGDHVYGTAVSLKGTLVAVGTAEGSVAVWDTGSGVIVARAKLSKQPIVGVTMSHDGQVFLVKGQKEPYVRGSYDRWLIKLTSPTTGAPPGTRPR